jgi:hypothetical protein
MRRDWNEVTREPDRGTTFPAIFTGLLTGPPGKKRAARFLQCSN